MGRGRIRRVRCLAFLVLSVATVFLPGGLAALAQGAEHVDAITVEGVIDPLTAQYCVEGLRVFRRTAPNAWPSNWTRQVGRMVRCGTC